MAENEVSVKVDENATGKVKNLRELMTELREEIQKTGDEMKKLNENISQLKPATSRLEQVLKILSGFNTVFSAVKNVAGAFQYVKETATKCFDVISKSSERSISLMGPLGAGIKSAQKILSLFGTISGKVAEKVSSIGENVKKSGGRWSAFKENVKKAVSTVKSFGERLKKSDVQVSSTGEKVKKSGRRWSAFKANVKKAATTVKSFGSGLKKIGGSVKSFGSKIGSLLGKINVFGLLKQGATAMVEAMKKGFENLGQYSSEYSNAMGGLKSQMSQFENSLAAAFEPIANAVIPYITQLVSWLTTAADTMGQFLAAVQGKSTYTKATKQMGAYAESLDTASEAARRSLSAFDELNVLSEDSSSESESESSGADAFEVGVVDTQISAAAGSVRESLQALKDSLSGWFQGLDFAPLLDSLEKLKVACEPFLGYIFEGLLWFFKNVLQPIGSWTMESALPAFFELLAEGMAALDTVLVALKPVFDYVWNNILVPMGQFVGDIFIDAINMIKDAFASFVALFEEKSDKINSIMMAVAQTIEFLWKVIIQPVIQFIMGAVKTLVEYIVKIVGDIIDILFSIIEFIKNVFMGNWESAWDSLVDVFKGILNGVIDIVEGIVNAIIEGLNAISFTVPDWVPGIGGTDVGFNIERIELPHLADGAVIQGGKPFAAILGDQRFGQTNIETPLQTMVDAFKLAMADSGTATGGNYTFVAQLDGRTIFKETVKQDQLYRKSTGYSAFI